MAWRGKAVWARPGEARQGKVRYGSLGEVRQGLFCWVMARSGMAVKVCLVEACSGEVWHGKARQLRHVEFRSGRYGEAWCGKVRTCTLCERKRSKTK